jgi:hypothetical protein
MWISEKFGHLILKGEMKMHTSKVNFEKLLGIQTGIHHHKRRSLEAAFAKPIIHKQITGEEVYVPLDTDRLWGVKRIRST